MKRLTEDSYIHVDVSNGSFTELGKVLLVKRQAQGHVCHCMYTISTLSETKYTSKSTFKLWSNGTFSIAQEEKSSHLSKELLIFVIHLFTSTNIVTMKYCSCFIP